ncbi:putative porin [soil metagenome]
MPRNSNIIFFILFLFLSHSGFAVSADSTTVKVPTILRYTTSETGINGSFIYFSLDTVLDDLQIFNPAIKYHYHDLGNIGSAADPLLFTYAPDLLTEFGNKTFSLYQWNTGKVRYYKTNKRFSNIDYHLSGGKEQQITITLAQNIFPNWNVGIDFNRGGALGFQNNGKTFTTNFDFFTWFHLPNNRYHVFASATWNSIQNSANGGLTDDSLYSNNNFTNNDLQGLKVSLTTAEQHVRNHIFSLTHYYDLFKRKDSTVKELPLLRLTHSSEYERSSYYYGDNGSDSTYYNNNYFSSDITDSLHFDQWENKISLQGFHTFENFKPVHAASVDVAGGYQWFRYEQLFDTTLTNYFAEARIRTSGIKDLTTLDVSGRYILSGANKNDYLFRLTFRFPLIWGADMQIGLQDARRSPSQMQTFYQSNHFIWKNNFDKTTSRQFFFRINLEKYHFSVGGTSTFLGRYIYYNEIAVPVQILDTVRVSQLFIQKDFKLGQFRFRNTVWVQETTNDKVRIPALVSHHTLFYENIFFGGRLPTQIGFDVHYTSSWFSNAYMPATSVFYTQNEKKTEAYPLIDFFVNFKIKTARIFIKFQNAGDNLVGNNYFNTPNYPLPGLVFQFGLNWRFFD